MITFIQIMGAVLLFAAVFADGGVAWKGIWVGLAMIAGGELLLWLVWRSPWVTL